MPAATAGAVPVVLGDEPQSERAPVFGLRQAQLLDRVTKRLDRLRDLQPGATKLNRPVGHRLAYGLERDQGRAAALECGLDVLGGVGVNGDQWADGDLTRPDIVPSGPHVHNEPNGPSPFSRGGQRLPR